jgi:glycosyltransferase involved in cell wall biosynthesis
VNRHLQLCDVYLQPSLWDGMPNALLEAMAAGCGCIGSDAGGIPEIIESGVNGTIVPRWELHRLGDAVLEWLSADPAYRDSVRAAARDRMIANFGFDRERVQLQAVVNRLIPSSS